MKEINLDKYDYLVACRNTIQLIAAVIDDDYYPHDTIHKIITDIVARDPENRKEEVKADDAV